MASRNLISRRYQRLLIINKLHEKQGFALEYLGIQLDSIGINDYMVNFVV